MKKQLKNFIPTLNFNYNLDGINLDEYNKINIDEKNKFLDENKENFKEFNKLKEIDYKLEYINNLKLNIKELIILKDEKNINLDELKILYKKNKSKEIKENIKELEKSIKEIENKINNFNLLKESIKDLKEKKKKIIDENLNNKFFNIYNLENFIKYLDENKNKLINDKKNINKLGIELNLMDKSIYENIINYFIILFFDKDYYLNKDILNKKIKSQYSKKDLILLDELKTFNFKDLKSNFLENFNNKYIIDFIKYYEGIIKSKSINLDEFKQLFIDKDENKENYKFNLLLIKENIKDLKTFKEYKNKYYKKYQKKENNINMNIKRKSKYLKEKYKIFDKELNKDIINKDELKKQVYKKNILFYKNNIYFKNSKESYKEYINNKNIKYLNYLNKNLDLDLDKDKKYKKLKLILDYKLK